MTKRILIVDDNLMMRQMLVTQLSTLGYTDVSKAVNGVDAMSQLLDAADKGTPFDMILLDWSMPEMNGMDFLVKCRSNKRFAQMAIVMITSEGEPNNIMKALEVGATSYLAKPFSPLGLQDKIKQIVEWLDSVKTDTQGTHAG